MVSTSDAGRYAGDLRRLRHELRGVATGGSGDGLRVVFLGPQLVERPGEPLSRAPGVHEDQCCPVRHDLLVDGVLNVGPDRFLLREGGFLIHSAGHPRPGSQAGGTTQPLTDEAGADERLVNQRFIASSIVFRRSAATFYDAGCALLPVDALLLLAGRVLVARGVEVFGSRWILEVRHHAADLDVPILPDRRVDHRDGAVASEEAGHRIHRVHRRR